MAFLSSFDPSVPTDASPASSGDDELRSIKAGVVERMNTLVEDFEDGTLVEGATILKLRADALPTQVKIFTSGTLAARPNPPTADDLLYYAEDSDQFFTSRPSAVVGEFEWGEAKKLDEEVEIVALAISAGEDRFKLTEVDTRATRVKNAINTAKLSSSAVKVIYIPKSMWGYIADLDFDSNMFDPNILMVREGSMVSWYDPVAYGADATGNVNSRAAIETCYAHAATTTVGMKMVAFTVPGSYLMVTDVDQRDVALFQGAGTAIAGGGVLTGTRPFRIPADPAPAIDAAFTYNPQAGGNKATSVVIAKRLHLRVEGATDAAGLIVVSFADAGFEGAYDVANLITAVATFRNQIDLDQESTPLSVDAVANTITLDLSVAGAGATPVVWDLYLTFSA